MALIQTLERAKKKGDESLSPAPAGFAGHLPLGFLVGSHLPGDAMP